MKTLIKHSGNIKWYHLIFSYKTVLSILNDMEINHGGIIHKVNNRDLISYNSFPCVILDDQIRPYTNDGDIYMKFLKSIGK